MKLEAAHINRQHFLPGQQQMQRPQEPQNIPFPLFDQQQQQNQGIFASNLLAHRQIVHNEVPNQLSHKRKQVLYAGQPQPREFSNIIQHQGIVSKIEGSVTSQDSDRIPFGSGNRTVKKPGVNYAQFLQTLIHVVNCCKDQGERCSYLFCSRMRQYMWLHFNKCSDALCKFRCRERDRKLRDHLGSCSLPNCQICENVKRLYPFHSFWSGLERRKSEGGVRVEHNAAMPNYQTSENLQVPMKRMKLDSHTDMDFLENEKFQVPVASADPSPAPREPCHINEPEVAEVAMEPSVCPIQEIDEDFCQIKGDDTQEAYINEPEVAEVAMEPSVCPIQEIDEDFCQIKGDDTQEAYKPNPDVDPIVPEEFSVTNKQENEQLHTGDQTAMEVEHEIPTSPAGMRSEKPKIKGVSLTEVLTLEQIQEHIISCRQWVGQRKANAEKNQVMVNSMNQNSCQLCGIENLFFEPPPIYCSSCGSRIKRNAFYYAQSSAGRPHSCFCISCYNGIRGESITVDGVTSFKSELERKRNDDETVEGWVSCDKCEAWQHQICALFNARKNEGGQAEYICPKCYVQEIERGERKPLLQSFVLGAKDLPRTHLSDHLEQRLFQRLKQEREERAKLSGKNFDEVPGAESLVIRVVLSVDKKVEVRPWFLEIFREDNYPVEFPYKSKAILLFQKIEGVEVCLFCMWVQEFGSECPYPNQRSVYLSFVDSVKYFRPEIKTVTGEALRTFVYQEILMGYFDYCKKRGFSSCYIWACPPLKGDDYILNCHPEIQKMPKCDKLREWYLVVLRKAAKENIVVGRTNLYDHFFVSSGKCMAKVSAARLPYFEGDYWPGAAEDMVRLQQQDHRKLYKKPNRMVNKRALKAAGHSTLSGNSSKDYLLMQKLGETIYPMRQDFIVVHFQHACTHCCEFIISGKRWVCNLCKQFQLCERCHDIEEKLDVKDKHPSNSKVKHILCPVGVNDVPSDTVDKDEILDAEFFESRHTFLSHCQRNHYQFDTLRRAKHSTMMILYHLHNPSAPAIMDTCIVCRNDIEAGQGWHCEICPGNSVCDSCYNKEGGVDHTHQLKKRSSLADCKAHSTEVRRKISFELQLVLDLLVHASECHISSCTYSNCHKVKGLFRHATGCKIRAAHGCVYCKKMWALLRCHSRLCKQSECHVPRCKDLKDHVKMLQSQSDYRRRTGVMERMRQQKTEREENQ